MKLYGAFIPIALFFLMVYMIGEVPPEDHLLPHLLEEWEAIISDVAS